MEYFSFVSCFGHSLLDLALKQKAEQVSTAHDGEASRAVDGDTRTDYDSGTCMHTYFSSDAWWRVDLGASVPVAEVVIVNRRCTRKMDPECITYMDSFQIKIGKVNIQSTRVFISKARSPQVFLFSCFFAVIFCYVVSFSTDVHIKCQKEMIRQG